MCQCKQKHRYAMQDWKIAKFFPPNLNFFKGVTKKKNWICYPYQQFHPNSTLTFCPENRICERLATKEEINADQLVHVPMSLLTSTKWLNRGNSSRWIGVWLQAANSMLKHIDTLISFELNSFHTSGFERIPYNMWRYWMWWYNRIHYVLNKT